MLYVFCLINVIAFFVYGLDKLKAVNHWWRIPDNLKPLNESARLQGYELWKYGGTFARGGDGLYRVAEEK